LIRYAKFLNFFSSPRKGQELQWAKAIKRANRDGSLWIPKTTHSVCSKHFLESQIDRTGQTVRIRDGCIPCVFPKFPAHPKVSTGADDWC
jgi:hypothetical protein